MAVEYPTKEVNVLVGHQGTVSTVKFSGDGNYCISGGNDKTIRLWNPAKGKNLFCDHSKITFK